MRHLWCLVRGIAAHAVVLLLISSICPLLQGQQASHLRISTWYWLNSAPMTQWQTDFKDMKELGITDVVLVWGLDATAFSVRTADSHEAIRAAHAAGLGSYLFVWHARHAAMHHVARFEQVDAAGHSLFAFDAFNPKWRRTQWKPYLRKLARLYGPEPGMSGYIFDNSFAIGRIAAIDGPEPKPLENYLSYGRAESTMFRRPLPVSPQDPAWGAWTKARQGWWADWAADTKRAIRSVDRNPRHQIVLEDGENTIDPDTGSRVGLKLGGVTPYFDTMSAYWAPDYSSPDTAQLASGVKTYLSRMHTAVGLIAELAFTLRLSDDASEDAPGLATRPTLEQVVSAIDASLAMGVRHIDLYGYRMGIYHLDGPGWRQYQPGTAKAYPLTGQMEGKFLADRPALRAGLKAYFAKLEATY